MKAHRVLYFDDIIGVVSKESDESHSSSPLLLSPPSESIPPELYLTHRRIPSELESPSPDGVPFELDSPPSESLPSELDMFAGSPSIGLPELSREWFEDDEIAEEERPSKSKNPNVFEI